MSGTPVKAVTGTGTAAGGAVLAQTGLGLHLFAVLVATVSLIIAGALLVRSARMTGPTRPTGPTGPDKPGRRG